MRSDAAHDWLIRNDVSGNLILTDTVAETLELLAAGRGDYALAPRLVGLLTAKKLDLTDIEPTGPLIDAYGRGYGFAVTQGNTALLAVLNEGLRIVKANGTYDAVYDKWFGVVDPRGIPYEVIVRYVLWGIVGILVIGGLVFLWIVMLRSTVKRQTVALQAAYEGVERMVEARTRELNAEIAEHRIAEEELKEAQERLCQLFDNMDDGVAVYRETDDGQDFVFVDLNRAGQTHSHVLLNEVVGRRLTEVFPGVEQMGLLDVFRRVSKTGEPEHLPLVEYFDERFTEWVENYVFKLPSGLIVAIYSDTTETHHAEEMLRQAQKMEAIGQLTGGLAHDLNNVLGIIGMNVDIVRRKLADVPKVSGNLDYIKKGVNRAADLVRRLLDYSRTEARELQRVSVNDFISEMEDLIAKSLTPAIELKLSLSDKPWTVEIDPGDFEGAIINLALNARDSMPGGGTLVIETANKVIDKDYVDKNPGISAGEFVLVSVSDTGARHDSGGLEESGRAVFHDQGGRPGYGSRIEHGLRFLPALGRPPEDLLRTRRRDFGFMSIFRELRVFRKPLLSKTF